MRRELVRELDYLRYSTLEITEFPNKGIQDTSLNIGIARVKLIDRDTNQF